LQYLKVAKALIYSEDLCKEECPKKEGVGVVDELLLLYIECQKGRKSSSSQQMQEVEESSKCESSTPQTDCNHVVVITAAAAIGAVVGRWG
jgi:hypothetical protein